MVQYKLYYFNGKGRAEVARFLFALADQAYEDVRIQREEWPTHKPNMPFGQVPVLEVINDSNVLKIPQSTAINRYLGNKFGFGGKTLEDNAKIDSIADFINDMLVDLTKAYYESDEAKKKAAYEKYYGETIHNFLKHFDKILEENKSGYLCGDSVTWVDVTLFVILSDWIPDESKVAIFSSHAAVKAHSEKLRGLPKIADWIAKRPVTEM